MSIPKAATPPSHFQSPSLLHPRPQGNQRGEEVQAARRGWGAPGAQTQAALPLGPYRSRFGGTCCSSSLDTWTVHSQR